MTNKEIVRKNIELTFDFIREIIKDPNIGVQLPDKCDIDFIEKDFTSLTKKNFQGKYLIKVDDSFGIVKKKSSNGSGARMKLHNKNLKK